MPLESFLKYCKWSIKAESRWFFQEVSEPQRRVRKCDTCLMRVFFLTIKVVRTGYPLDVTPGFYMSNISMLVALQRVEVQSEVSSDRHYLENRNQCLVSHMSTDLPSSSKRLNLMIWTLPLIWGQKIQELVKYLKSFLGKFALASKPKERTPYLLTQKMKLQDPLSSLILVIMPGFKVQEERPVLLLKNYIKIELVKSSSWYEQWLVAMKILTG